MRTILVITFLLATSTFLASQQAAGRANATPAAADEIKALETKLADLIVRGDWDEYASHLASDYLHTRDNGHVEGKDQVMVALRDVNRKIIVMEMETSDAIIHIYGDAAVANAEFTTRVRDSGQVKSRRIRLTDVFVKRDSQWSLIAEQETLIGK
jgi:ketosteroid isomerase-like protein